MAESRQLIDEFRARLQPVAIAAKHWEQEIAVDTNRVRCLLPARDRVRQPVHLQPLSASAMPSRFRGSLPQETIREVKGYYWKTVVRSGCSHSSLLRTLSSITHELAISRMLIHRNDRFDVSGRSVLAAVSLANYMHVMVRWSKERDNSILTDRELQQSIVWPLQAADHYFPNWRPADLWWMDLAARSALTAAQSATRKYRDRKTLNLVGPLLLEFVRRCVSVKLLETSALGKELAQLARYDLWPGLDTIAADPGAAALRGLLCTELIAQLEADQTGIQQVAFLQLLSALSAAQADRLWSRRILVARLFWELMEFNPDLLERVKKRGPAASALDKAFKFLRDALGDTADADEQDLEARFRDIWSSLQAWEIFRDLEASFFASGASRRTSVFT